MQLVRKQVGGNGVLREYQHERHGKVLVVSLDNGVIVVGHEHGWDYVAHAHLRRERHVAELKRMIEAATPKRAPRRKKAAAAETARRQA
jgi:sugar phosphate isomerase/epimerase